MNRHIEAEEPYAGKRFSELDKVVRPPCLGERVTFMSSDDIYQTKNHPYVEHYPKSHGHFAPTPFKYSAYSAACVPFRWMLHEKVEGSARDGIVGLSESLELGYDPQREPEIINQKGKSLTTAWVQEGDNQLALLDTFFGALRPEESLCFFYAKRTPLSEQSRRVIIGVGRVLSVGSATEYEYKVDDPPLRCYLWERNIGHSIRPGFVDGFLFPYREILELAEKEMVNPEEYVAFAPGEYFDSYSYGSELLTHDGAVASLVACSAVLERIKNRIEGPWDRVIGWINTQLNRLWEARGAYPGLGSSLSAFGYEWGFKHGTLLAYEIELLRERRGDGNSWELVDSVMKEPSILDSPVTANLTQGLRKGWQNLRPTRRNLLELLSRCAISEKQALRVYDNTERENSGLEISDEELLANPYLLYELDRSSNDPISFGTIDRGLFPEEKLRKEYPVPEPSRIDDPVDQRRVRALVVSILERAADEGHSLLPRSWVIQRARELQLSPHCPLGENVLEVTEDSFEPVIKVVSTADGKAAYQVDRLADCRRIIRREILSRKKGRAHTASHNWGILIEQGLNEPLPQEEEEQQQEARARQEKTIALEQLYRSRLAVLIGQAGTGKTTLLRILSSIDDVRSKGLLLLAPTGKARVRLEEQTGLRGSGFTLAQFLLKYNRYDGERQAYYPNPQAPKCKNYRTVIVDECSMLTEEQLAALIDALSNVERLVLVGDPRQLPPIGSGRPFVDIVNLLAPEDVGTTFPRCGPGYAELTIPRRQQGGKREDIILASHFNGQPLEPGADEVWDLAAAGSSSRLKLIRWNQPEELQRVIVEELVNVLKLTGPDDELGFELSIGGSSFKDFPHAYFWKKSNDQPGAAAKADAWQMISPVRADLVGVDALNLLVQQQFRAKWCDEARKGKWRRKTPEPFGPQSIIYGDKVINVINSRRRDVYPKDNPDSYIANGDIGIVIGQYKTKNFKGRPWLIKVEFAGQLGYEYGYKAYEFGDNGSNPLELAYCLTVHKTQGSEFGITFVVLPNPCWLLSRELLYTALTRHKERLVILHQGPFAAFRDFSGDEYSEIARRLTNLFTDPTPQEVFVGTQSRFLEQGLIHRTERGELVRSKSEVIIADKLHSRGIDYAYEQPLHLPDGGIRYPDFTICDDAGGITYYWEHLGLLDDPGYRSRWERKRAEYLAAGIQPWTENADHERVLLVTSDKSGGRIDSAEIAELIDKSILQF